MDIFKVVLISFLHLSAVLTEYSGDIDIGYSPPSIRFSSATPVKFSELHNIIGSLSGYSVKKSIWKGLTVTTPFHYPKGVIVFGIQSGGSSLQREGISYKTVEDASFDDVFERLKSLIDKQTQRVPYCEKNDVSKMINRNSAPLALSVKYLQKTREPDATFLQEMSLLPSITEKLEDEGAVSRNAKGQDFVFVDITTYEPIMKEYGVDSKEAKEAGDILRISVDQTLVQLRKFYNNRVFVSSLMLANNENHSRSKRSTDPSSTISPKTLEEYNIADAYGEDYPVMFNIILLLSIILGVTIIAVSVAMATMDPGRDSIIYRMTNPRMKKDQ